MLEDYPPILYCSNLFFYLFIFHFIQTFVLYLLFGYFIVFAQSKICDKAITFLLFILYLADAIVAQVSHPARGRSEPRSQRDTRQLAGVGKAAI